MEPYFSFAIGLCEQEVRTVLQEPLGSEAASLYQPWRFDCDVSLEVRIAPLPRTVRFEGHQECLNEVAMFHNVRTVHQPISRHLARPMSDYWLILSRCRIVIHVLVLVSSRLNTRKP